MLHLPCLPRLIPRHPLKRRLSVHQLTGLLGDPVFSCHFWSLHPVHLLFDCRKLRLPFWMWSDHLSFNWPDFLLPLVNAVPQQSFPLEHFQDHPVICVQPCLSNPLIDKVVPVCSNNVIPLPRHLPVVPFHPPHPATVPSL